MGRSFFGLRSPVLRLASLILLFSFAFSLFSVNYAQVKIKEKVEIKPSTCTNNKANNLNKTASTHTLTVSKNSGEGKYIWLREDNGGGCSGETLAYNPNGGTITATVVYGERYCIAFNGLGSLKAYLDGVLILDVSIAGRGHHQLRAVFPPCGDDADRCTDEPLAPEIITQKVEPEIDYCLQNADCPNSSDKVTKGGYFLPFLEEPYENVEVDACYDEDAGKWKFKVKNGNKIKVKYNLKICDNILAEREYKIIYDTNQVKLISDAEICLAYKHFLRQRYYPGLPYGPYNRRYGLLDGQYLLYEAVTGHENFHLKDLEDYMENTYNKNDFSNKFLEYQPSCNEVSSKADAEKKGSEHYNNVQKKYRKKLKDMWGEKTGEDYISCNDLTIDEIRYEKNTQKRVELEIINKYIKILKIKYGEDYFRNNCN